jgi:hypothetical protein
VGPLFRLSPQRVEIEAPCPLVWEMITSVGRGQIPGSRNTARLVERKSDNVLIAEFVTHSGDKVYTTLEEMTTPAALIPARPDHISPPERPPALRMGGDKTEGHGRP